MAGGKNDKDAQRPIIIKKIKKGGHGHHGGAWKVAYADFVTAMMAFFLLLWLLSTTSKATLEGLSEYFTPTVGIKDSQGIGFKGGTAESEAGTNKTDASPQGLVTGRTPQGSIPETPQDEKIDADQEANFFKKGQTEVEKKFTQDTVMQQYKDNVAVKQTPEGLQIDIMDSEKYDMFERGSPKLTTHGKAIFEAIAPILKKMPNFMSIAGHTDASPAETGKAEYTNWELSADRAQAVRRFLTTIGLEAERPKKVLGLADRELYTPKEPRGPKNRRVTLVMLKGSHILIPEGAVPKADKPAGAPAASVPAAVPSAPAPAPAAAH